MKVFLHTFSSKFSLLTNAERLIVATGCAVFSCSSNSSNNFYSKMLIWVGFFKWILCSFEEPTKKTLKSLFFLF
jgi:hypothetical protein